jgi:hypothetical protein
MIMQNPSKWEIQEGRDSKNQMHCLEGIRERMEERISGEGKWNSRQ